MLITEKITAEARLAALVQLGKDLSQLDEATLQRLYAQAKAHNAWFTEESVQLALQGTIRYLGEDALRQWASAYDIPETTEAQKVGIIMAGNLPLVGIHDLICVLASGHHALVKLSSQDPVLPKFLSELLIGLDERFAPLISFEEGIIPHMDAVIATGSDNSSRYFEYYFGKYPHIIRKNRTSCAVLTGQESREDLVKLSEDVLTYFGLGCRNVSKLFVPTDYNFSPFMEASQQLANKAAMNHKYVNNYDYHKSIYLVNQEPFLDNGALMLKASDSYHSPASVVFFEHYSSLEAVKNKLQSDAELLQCIVAKDGKFTNSLPFGQAQHPAITDYADHVDTMAFLLKL